MIEQFLESLRDDPMPPSSVDVGRALADGRRRVRNRRLTAIAAAGCTALALVGGIGVLDVRPPGVDGDRGPTGGQQAVTTPPMPAPAPAAFDPLLRYAAFGWLPDGLTDSSVKIEADQFLLTALAPTDGKDWSGVELRLVPAGHDIALARTDDFAVEPGVTQGWAEVTAAEPVNGRPARWNGKALGGGAGAALRWEYAPNAWAEVVVGGRAAGPDANATARRIATMIRYGVDEQVRLPFRIARLPATLRPMSISVSTTAGGAMGWNVQVGYGAGRRTKYGDWPLTVIALPRTSRTGDGGVVADPDTTLDGDPARRTPMADGGRGLQVYDVQGCYLELATHDAATITQLPGGLDGLFRGMTLYPNPRDWR